MTCMFECNFQSGTRRVQGTKFSLFSSMKTTREAETHDMFHDMFVLVRTITGAGHQTWSTSYPKIYTSEHFTFTGPSTKTWFNNRLFPLFVYTYTKTCTEMITELARRGKSARVAGQCHSERIPRGPRSHLDIQS